MILFSVLAQLKIEGLTHEYFFATKGLILVLLNK